MKKYILSIAAAAAFFIPAASARDAQVAKPKPAIRKGTVWIPGLIVEYFTHSHI